MKTAVEFLVHMYALQGVIYQYDIDKAIEMEKEQIVNAHYQGYRPSIGTTEISEKYFNETFKSK
jgi:hypothetical protein